MKRLALAAVPAVAFSLTSLTSAAIAQVIGRYNVEGRNPSGSTYAGTARIEKTGGTYRVGLDHRRHPPRRHRQRRGHCQQLPVRQQYGDCPSGQ